MNLRNLCVLSRAFPCGWLDAFILLALALGLAQTQAADPATGASASPSRSPRKPSPPPSLADLGWVQLFDGQTLKGWKEADFAGKGVVKIENSQIALGMGNDMTGITWTNEVLRSNYEVALEAKRVDGSDFFCGLTFPVKKDPCSLIVGGWGGGVIGLSSLDGYDAANNETTQYMQFQSGRWYLIRLRVTDAKIEAWIDDKQVVDLALADHAVSIRIEVEESKPFGIATWRTASALRNLKWRKMDVPDAAPTAPAKS